MAETHGATEVKVSKTSNSLYFTLNGKNFRVSDHASMSGLLNTVVKNGDSPHEIFKQIQIDSITKIGLVPASVRYKQKIEGLTVQNEELKRQLVELGKMKPSEKKEIRLNNKVLALEEQLKKQRLKTKRIEAEYEKLLIKYAQLQQK